MKTVSSKTYTSCSNHILSNAPTGVTHLISPSSAFLLWGTVLPPRHCPVSSALGYTRVNRDPNALACYPSPDLCIRCSNRQCKRGNLVSSLGCPSTIAPIISTINLLSRPHNEDITHKSYRTVNKTFGNPRACLIRRDYGSIVTPVTLTTPEQSTSFGLESSPSDRVSSSFAVRCESDICRSCWPNLYGTALRDHEMTLFAFLPWICRNDEAIVSEGYIGTPTIGRQSLS